MFQQLLDELQPTFLDVCRSAIAKRPDERFYCVALYTSGEYNYIADSLSTVEGLERVARRYLERDHYQQEWGTVPVAMNELRWSPCDSPLHCEFDGEFNRTSEILDAIWADRDQQSDADYTATCQGIYDACVAALNGVREAGLFDDERVVFNLLMGDQSDEERLLNAEAVNSQTALEFYRRGLEIDEERLQTLRDSRWSRED